MCWTLFLIPPTHVLFSRPSQFDCVSVTVIEGHRQRTENEKLITSNIVYREVF